MPQPSALCSLPFSNVSSLQRQGVIHIIGKWPLRREKVEWNSPFSTIGVVLSGKAERQTKVTVLRVSFSTAGWGPQKATEALLEVHGAPMAPAATALRPGRRKGVGARGGGVLGRRGRRWRSRDPPPRHRLVAEAYDVAGQFPVPEAVVAALEDAEDIPSVAAWGRGVPGSLLLSSAAAAIKWSPKSYPPPRDRPIDRLPGALCPTWIGKLWTESRRENQEIFSCNIFLIAHFYVPL